MLTYTGALERAAAALPRCEHPPTHPPTHTHTHTLRPLAGRSHSRAGRRRRRQGSSSAAAAAAAIRHRLRRARAAGNGGEGGGEGGGGGEGEKNVCVQISSPVHGGVVVVRGRGKKPHTKKAKQAQRVFELELRVRGFAGTYLLYYLYST
jgi:hypothetical protein